MPDIVCGILGFIVLLLLLAVRIPIGFSFFISGVLGFVFLGKAQAGLKSVSFMSWTYSTYFALGCIPLFTLMGHFIHESGLSSQMFDGVYKWLGRLKGGVAMTTLGACVIFAACSGSSLAAVSTIGVIAYSEMDKYGYHKRLSLGSISAGGTLAVLIPPSAVMILYAIFAEVSIGKLFIAGILPGLILAAMLGVYVVIFSHMNPALAPAGPSFSFKERLSSLLGIIPAVLLIIAVLGGLWGGIFTPNEAGAVGALICMCIMIVKRRFTVQRLFSALLRTLETTSMIFFIIIGVNIFNSFLTASGLTTTITMAIIELPLPPLGIVAVMLMIYIPLGCVMDVVGMLAVTVPIFCPVVESLGFDLIWFGVLVTILSEMALITPPVGMNCYVLKNVVKEVSLEDIFRSIAPFCVAVLAALAVIFFFPQIALLLPGTIR